MSSSISIHKQPSLKQYGFYSKGLHDSIVSKTNEAYRTEEKPSVGIPFRRDGNGKGAYYDHYTMQLTTATRTRVIRHEDKKVSQLHEYVRQVTHQLPFGVDHQGAMSPVKSTREDFGLLCIPGISRSSFESEEGRVRKQFQSKLIQKARLSGRPILAICGGCWQLWEEFGGNVREVKGHNYRGGMPRIKETTGKVGHNKQVHRIRITSEGKILNGGMRIASPETVFPMVNSVHWLAPSEDKSPAEFEVSARSVEDVAIAPLVTFNDVTKPLEPEECIEAFESRFGVPILGVQWHPEAYTKNCPEYFLADSQIGILEYMIQAGKTYQLKKKMLAEFKSICKEKNCRTPWQRHSLKRVKVIGITLFRYLDRRDVPKKLQQRYYSHLFENPQWRVELKEIKKTQSRKRVRQENEDTLIEASFTRQEISEK